MHARLFSCPATVFPPLSPTESEAILKASRSDNCWLLHLNQIGGSITLQQLISKDGQRFLHSQRYQIDRTQWYEASKLPTKTFGSPNLSGLDRLFKLLQDSGYNLLSQVCAAASQQSLPAPLPSSGPSQS